MVHVHTHTDDDDSVFMCVTYGCMDIKLWNITKLCNKVLATEIEIYFKSLSTLFV